MEQLCIGSENQKSETGSRNSEIRDKKSNEEKSK